MINIGNILLAFFDYFGFKGRFAILRNLDLHTSVAGSDPFAFVTIPVIIVVGTLGFTVAEMLIHLSLHHLFDCTTEEIFQGFLDVRCGFNIVFLQQSLDDRPLSFRHRTRLIHFFFLVCHNNRPPMIYSTIEDLTRLAIYRLFFTPSMFFPAVPPLASCSISPGFISEGSLYITQKKPFPALSLIAL